MIKLYNDFKVKRFEYIYFFVMIIYMAQATAYTGRMVGGLTESPIFPFLLPIFLTIILLDRNKISFSHNGLSLLLLITGVWTGCIIYKESLYASKELSFYFFLFYAIIIAYIHVRVFGKKLFPLYEKIMVSMCVITLGLWLFAVLVPSSASFFRGFYKTGFGNNVFFIFTWMDPTRGQVENGIIRNAGFSWEPGRFSIMVLLAIYCNLLRNGIKFKNNRSGIILLLAMISTQSTTGYIGTLALYATWGLKKFNISYILGIVFVMLPIGYYVSQLSFMQEKIQEQLELDYTLKKLDKTIDYVNEVNQRNEYAGSLGRFQAIYYEAQNIQNDPLLGYGRNPKKSFFSTHISSNFVLTGGFLRLFGQHGIPLGLIFYFLLYKSSVRIGKEHGKNKVALFVIFIISLVSYSIFLIPVFTAFWLYGIFRKDIPIEDLKPKAITTKSDEETDSDEEIEEENKYEDILHS